MIIKDFLRKPVFFLVLFSLSFVGISQNNEPKFNLPPGSQLPPKFVFEDLSYKLNYSNLVTDIKSDFLDFSSEELNQMKENDVKSYNYYSQASAFFNSLSMKVRSIYTIKELWYIYSYDVNLANKLLTIK